MLDCPVQRFDVVGREFGKTEVGRFYNLPMGIVRQFDLKLLRPARQLAEASLKGGSIRAGGNESQGVLIFRNAKTGDLGFDPVSAVNLKCVVIREACPEAKFRCALFRLRRQILPKGVNEKTGSEIERTAQEVQKTADARPKADSGKSPYKWSGV